MKISIIKSILSFSILLNGGLLNAQAIGGVSSTVTDSTLRGSITWDLPDGLFQLVESYKKSNYASPGFEGFRVQVLSDAGNNAKDRAQSTLLKFEQEFPGTSVYLTYQQPNFKVRCGDYRTKAEARRLLNQINGQFPGAYIVRDFIKIP
jgi:hypothetical protein